MAALQDAAGHLEHGAAGQRGGGDGLATKRFLGLRDGRMVGRSEGGQVGVRAS